MEYNQAKKILNEKITLLDTVEIDLKDAYGKILAIDLVSNKDVPSFNRSPLDGYCFNFEDTKNASKDNPIYFEIIEEVPCGSLAKNKINKNQTIKIFTGSKIPDGANCVIRYEDVVIENGKLKLCSKLQLNENVIVIGEDIKKDFVFAKKGQRIDEGMMGVLASLGIKKITVYKDIQIGFLSTGSEILELEDNYVDGKIYNSNRYIFDSILKKNNINMNYCGIAKDNINELKHKLEEAFVANDIVISTGGVSVGDYDLVYKCLEDLGFDIFINHIDMKPGMACCFAKKNNKFVFALSGNPMSSVTTFYTVCLPAIKKMMGYIDFENKIIKVKLTNSFNKKISSFRVLRAKIDIVDGIATATLNLSQGNIVIKSLIDCNGLILANKENAFAHKIMEAILI